MIFHQPRDGVPRETGFWKKFRERGSFFPSSSIQRIRHPICDKNVDCDFARDFAAPATLRYLRQEFEARECERKRRAVLSGHYSQHERVGGLRMAKFFVFGQTQVRRFIIRNSPGYFRLACHVRLRVSCSRFQKNQGSPAVQNR